MQPAMQVILLYLFVAFGDGLARKLWPELQESVIENPYRLENWLQQRRGLNQRLYSAKAPNRAKALPEIKKAGDYLYGNAEILRHVNAQPKYKPVGPVLRPKDAARAHPHVRPKGKQIVAGLDNMKTIDERGCLQPLLRANTSLSSPVECARTCRKGDRKICYYNFVVENYQVNGRACELCTPNKINSFCSTCQCVLADGIERSAQTVNRQLPGPSIEVCEGDHVVIDVTNRMNGYDMSIHWHGIFQKGFQYYDGVPLLTQCPIQSGGLFRYQWTANNPGTHFWHAHSGLQKMDGVFGSLIVRQTPERDPHCHLYDFDLSTHVVVINDWMHEQASDHFPGRLFTNIAQMPDSILINGKGRYTDQATGNTTSSTLEVIDVEPGKRYRFRIINAFCTVCPGMITIQDHKMTIIATDGLDITPTTVDSLTSFAGERYDFILHTDKPVDSYWIQVRGVGDCARDVIQQVAILRYKGAPKEPESEPPSYDEGLPRGVVLNPINATCEVPNDDTICVSNLNSVKEMDKDILREPDLKFYLPVGFYQYTLAEIFRPNQYNRFIVATADHLLLDGLIDGISFTFPPSPPLSQPMDIPKDQYCNRTSVPSRCNMGVCSCTQKLDIPLNAVVELVLIDELQATNVNHPFHLHGHAFYVVGMGDAKIKNVTSINWQIVREMDKENQVNRFFDKPVKKDTIAVPFNGYVVLRFRADNPGYWLFHCHFIYHQMAGMEILLKVGEQKDVPPVPQNFPKCGPYVSEIGYNINPPFSKNTYSPGYM